MCETNLTQIHVTTGTGFTKKKLEKLYSTLLAEYKSKYNMKQENFILEAPEVKKLLRRI